MRQLKVIDLIWVVDENVERPKYKMARVVQVQEGSDNRFRTATVVTNDGKLKRPVVKLASLFYESVFGRQTGTAMLAPVNCTIRNSNSNVMKLITKTLRKFVKILVGKTTSFTRNRASPNNTNPFFEKQLFNHPET